MAERERGVEALDPTTGHGEVVHLHAVPETRLRGPYERFVKPVLDRTVGITLSALTAPALAVLVPLIWLRMGRPAIFRQQRVGLHGESFTVFKLRTMLPDRRSQAVAFDGADRRVNHKSQDDPRHTSLGRFLRKWSLDEIPQWWNVARGDMSVVGPRPELPSIVERYQPWQHRRHDVHPGVTGLWQVSVRGEIPMHEATEVDLEYVDSLSFMTDARILIRTPGAILGKNKGH